MTDRVLVLGAGGDMGRGIVEGLADAPVEAVAADLDRNALAAVQREYGVETERIDVTDDGAVETLAGYDVVASAIGPFYRFGEPVLGLAVEAGVDFVDICDDHDAVSAQLGHDDAARDAGSAAVVGCGWTPGLSNALAAYAADELGGADEIQVDWVGSAADSQGLAVIMHVFHVLDGAVPQFRDGALVDVPAGSMGHSVSIPDVGDVTTVACGHPEPLTLPDNLDADTVELRGALLPAYQNDLVLLANKLGVTGTQRRMETLSRTIHAVEDLFAVGGVDESAVRVTVQSGEDAVSYAAVGSMRSLTGHTAAVGARLLAEGDVDAGVHAPEAAFDPAAVLDAMTDFPVRFYRVPTASRVASF